MPEAVVQITMDAQLKDEVERLYKSMGISCAEAVRIFALQSVTEQAMPSAIKPVKKSPKRKLGIAAGKFKIPDNIDDCNDEIAEMFGVSDL